MRADHRLGTARALLVRGNRIDFAPRAEPTSAEEPAEPLDDIARQYDVCAMTPREMVELSFDLYLAGYLTREQHTELAFQPELMPNYEETIGALTGEPADPDRPRDYTEIWRQRLGFEAEHATEDLDIVERTQGILMVLEDLERTRHGRPTKLIAAARSPVELPPSLLKMAAKV